MKKIFNYLIIPILLIISYEILTNSQEIINSVNFSFNIWKNNIFPSLFPFFIISNLLINYGFVELLSEICKPLMSFFKVNPNASFIFIMGMLSGFPSSAIYTKKILDEGLINNKDAMKILMFSHFSNPLFILGTLSIMFLNNKKAGLLILFTHYISNFIIAILFRGLYPYRSSAKINLKDGLNKMKAKINNSPSIGSILSKTINTSISTLLTILGTITVFLCLTTIINDLIPLNDIHKSIFNGLFELTQGLKYVSLLNISLKLKTTISSLLISFGGLSIHMQVISSINDDNIKYTPYLIARIIHASIASLLTVILFDKLI